MTELFLKSHPHHPLQLPRLLEEHLIVPVRVNQRQRLGVRVVPPAEDNVQRVDARLLVPPDAVARVVTGQLRIAQRLIAGRQVEGVLLLGQAADGQRVIAHQVGGAAQHAW